MPNNEQMFLKETEGDASAVVASTWRKKKAEKQPRDANGRWISDGARITYYDAVSEKMVAGTVVASRNGRVIVDRDNPDGSTTQEKIPNETVEVVYSKARLPRPGTEYKTEADNSFNSVIDSKKFQNGILAERQGTIFRNDGYRLEATVGEANKDNKNPISYQLFAPSGRSLGTYSEKAASNFNAMADEDKQNPEKLIEDAEASTEAEAPAESSGDEALFSVIRLSRDGKSSILSANGEYFSANLETKTLTSSNSLETLLANGSWRRPTKAEASFYLQTVKHTELSQNTITASVEKTTPYRVPAKIKTAITAALEASPAVSESDLEKARVLATEDAVSIDEVRWIKEFLSNTEKSKDLAGGAEGSKWADKVLEGFADSAKHDFAQDRFAYFAIGDGQDGWKVNDILAVDFSTDEVYSWGPEGFTLSNLTVEHVDEPVILPIDEFSAESLATWIDNGRDGGTFNLADIDPIERNLVELALSELDLDELETIGTIIAAGSVVDVDAYSPAERSKNAQNQPRASGGRFGSKPNTPEAPVAVAEEVMEQKAVLPEELPLVENVGERISSWLEVAPVTAAAGPVAEEAAAETTEEPTAAPETTEEPATEESADSAQSKSLYFAIVDNVDRTSVLDVIAITKNDLGQAEAWKRNGATWVPAPDYLARFNGTTPPPVVELEVPEPAKAVLSQVDVYDSERGNTAETEEVPAAEEAPATEPTGTPVTASSGFSAGNWSIYTVQDLENAVTVYSMASDSVQKELRPLIRKRAFAMNRMDLVPAEIRTATLAERGEQFLNTSPLFGEHGEIIVAAGVPGVADTPSDWAAARRLQNYWTRGKGALKIRWGTPGDLTRAHRHLAKYVGPQRAWGLAQRYHKSIFGVYNHTHDVATGQYRPRRRKRR